MPNDKLKRAISVVLSLSMITSAPQIGSANLVPINGILAPSSTPPCQTVIAPSDAADGFSMKSFEAKISKALKPSKNVETENVKRKALATDASGTCGNGVTYTFKADTGTLTISYSGTGDGAMTDFGYPNYAPWESYKQDIQAVIIENGVTSIGDMAFHAYDALTSVKIPDSVTSFGFNSFSGCSKLTSVRIPPAITEMGYNTFGSCDALASVELNNDYAVSKFRDVFPYKQIESINLGDGVTSIASDAFNSCSNLNSINIPESVTEIGESAFIGCTSLISITIPDKVTSIGDSAFSGCSGLTSFNVAEGNLNYASFDGVLYNKDFSEIVETPKGKKGSLTLHDNLTSIKSSAFDKCNGLTSVTIRSGVASIESLAFSGCSSLTSITIPDSVTSIGEYAFYGCSGLTSITIPDSVTFIGNNAFRDCSGLTFVSIGKGVTKIDTAAFAGCNSLISLELNNNYATSGYISTAFSGFTSKPTVKSITLGSSITEIGNSAFYGFDALETVTIPASVDSVGSYAFRYCKELSSVTYMGTTAPKSGSSVFDYCDKLTIVNVPQGYNKNTFCGKPVNKTAIPDTPGEGETPSGGELPDPTGEGDPSTSEVVDSSSEDDNDPAPPPGDSNKGSSNAGVIAGSVVAAVAVVAAVVVTAVMYVKKLACFGRAVGGSMSEG